MKRVRMWLKELSLFQQLLTIIFIVSTVFILCFFTIVMSSLDNFVQNQMYSSIHRAQEHVSFYLNEGLAIQDISDNLDENTAHFLYDNKSKNSHFIGSDGIDHEDIIKVIQGIEIKQSEVRDLFYVRDNLKIMYSVKNIGNDIYLITMINSEYVLQYRDSLVDSIIKLNLVIVSFLFILLMVWIGTIILPLNQIRNYIYRVRIGEEVNFKIDRRDEIGAVADALVDMQEELSKQKRLREEMVQNISHDLKTPIATIKSYGESIKDGIYPYETLEKSVDVIIEHASRLEKKVYSLITLNKMGYLLEDELQEIDVKEIIEKVILSLKVIRPEIEIETHLNDVIFKGHEEPWRITVENILDNAIRYAKSKIVIVLKDKELTIENDGPLIERERLDKLFNMYEKGTDGQFGLGLSIVKKVCRSYGYYVSAENLNDGVKFSIKDQK
ncbi:MAG: ATP-binding protein [Anaerorhabdus sp.]